jgi:hypothetical protein
LGTKTTQSGCWKKSEKLEAVSKTVDLLKGQPKTRGERRSGQKGPFMDGSFLQTPALF